jgi:hypothetical protein
LLASLTALPVEGRDVPLTVVIRANAGRETWTRAFRGRRMGSTLRARGEWLEEHLGPATLFFRLRVADGAVVWTLEGVRALAVPLPVARWWSRDAMRGRQGSMPIASAFPPRAWTRTIRALRAHSRRKARSS